MSIMVTNFDIAICDVINSNSHLHYSETKFIPLFKDIFIEHFINNYQNHLSKIEKMIQNCETKSKIKSINIPSYEYRGKLNYKMLLTKMKTTYDILSIKKT